MQPGSSPSPRPAATKIDFQVQPIWSLTPWPLTVTFAGTDYFIPALPAADWLNILMDDELNLEAIFPGLAGPEAVAMVEEAIWSEAASPVELQEVALEVLQTVGGRKWWITVRLVGAAISVWNQISGEVVIRGLDAGRLSLGAWLDGVLHIILRGTDQSKHQMFLTQLDVPPPGFEDQVEEPEIAADMFMKMAD